MEQYCSIYVPPQKKSTCKNPNPMCSRVTYVEKKKKKSQFTNHQKPGQSQFVDICGFDGEKADNAGECADQNKIGSKTEGSHLERKRSICFSDVEEKGKKKRV